MLTMIEMIEIIIIVQKIYFERKTTLSKEEPKKLKVAHRLPTLVMTRKKKEMFYLKELFLMI